MTVLYFLELNVKMKELRLKLKKGRDVLLSEAILFTFFD